MTEASRFELQKTYTSYAIAISLEEFDSLGSQGRRAIKNELRELDLDLIEFDRQSDGAYLYLRIAAEDDTPDRHVSIRTILESQFTETQDLGLSPTRGR